MSVSVSLVGETTAQELFFTKSFQSNWGARVEKTIKIYPSIHPSVHLANKFLLAAHDVRDTVPDTGETTVKNRAIKIINPRKCKVMWRKKAESKHRK